MTFEDILFVISTGSSIAGSLNPIAGLAADAAVRLIKIGHDAYVSGRERGEWTDEQADHFDNVVLPTITSQPWWKKTDDAAPPS
jgi:hypothetical protein